MGRVCGRRDRPVRRREAARSLGNHAGWSVAAICSHFIPSITTPRDVFFQSLFPMSGIRSLALRTRSRRLPVQEVYRGTCSAQARNRERGIGTILCFGITRYHFAPVGRKLMDRRKPRSAWCLRSATTRDSGGGAGRGPRRRDCGPGSGALAGEAWASDSARGLASRSKECVPVVLVG